MNMGLIFEEKECIMIPMQATAKKIKVLQSRKICVKCRKDGELLFGRTEMAVYFSHPAAVRENLFCTLFDSMASRAILYYERRFFLWRS